MQPVDEQELAELFRDIEQRSRVPAPALDLGERTTSFREIDAGFDAEDVHVIPQVISTGDVIE